MIKWCMISKQVHNRDDDIVVVLHSHPNMYVAKQFGPMSMRRGAYIVVLFVMMCDIDTIRLMFSLYADFDFE